MTATLKATESDDAVMDGSENLKRPHREVGGDAETSGARRRRPLAEKEPAAAGRPPAAVWSSGVAFYPPSRKYWRIGGKWYDFADFLGKHPGGADVLKLARDRFEDCTFVFEAHHHNYKKVRAIIKKYEVPEEVVLADGLMTRPTRGDSKVGHHDAALDAGAHPRLLGDEDFYCVLRQRVTEHLKAVGHSDGGPTFACKALFWFSFVFWCAMWYVTWYTGWAISAVGLGLAASWLGAFGHNWVHQPKYRNWAYLSLDTIGFSSEGWFREHLLQHHMYTNTPWDNHFKGTEPFLVTDPTVQRNLVQRTLFPCLNMVILWFGLPANYMAHLVELLLGRENFSFGKLLLPLQIALLMNRWGPWGFALNFIANAVLGMYYFSLALMNHNAEHCTKVSERNKSRDWAEAQMHASADWSVGLSFWQAGIFLWLNFHTVHHVFPHTDFSHHPAIQGILMKTCDEYDIKYLAGEPGKIYREMITSFSTPRSLMQEVIVYAGGL